MKKIISILLLSSLFIGVLVGCGNESNKSENATTKTENIEESNKEANKKTDNVLRIGYFKGSAQIEIAKEDKLFEKYFGDDVKVEYQEFLIGPPMIEGLISGQLDLAITGDQPPITAIANKQPIEIIGKAAVSDKSMAFLVSTDSDIKKPEDLKGKNIGVAKGTSLEYFAVKYLEKYGISKNDVNFINLTTGEDTGASLASKKIDAGVTSIITAKLLEQGGQGIILGTTEGLITTISPILTSKEFREKNVEKCKNFLKLINEVQEISKNEKDRVINIIAEKSEINKSAAEYSYNDKTGVLLDDTDIDIFYNLYSFLKENNIVKNELKKEDIYTEILKKGEL